MSGTVAINIRGEALLLHPDRALLWPDRATAIVADTHFGKSSVFGRHGIAVPAGTDDEDRDRLTRLVTEHAIRRIIVLGDFLHAPLASSSPEAADLERWISTLSGVRIVVVAGNHDRGISGGWRGPLEWIATAYGEPPFRFVHDETSNPGAAGELFTLSGHIHPVIALRGLRKRISRVPAFWLRSNGMVLPSFGLFTGGCLISAAAGEQIFAVGPEQVTAFPPR
jgi:DNA ligase-associated metallophosphoesterase